MPPSEPSASWSDLLAAVRARYVSEFAFAFQWWLYNVPLLQRVQQLLPPPARVLEVGTGTGALSVLLAGHGYQVVGIDPEPEVVTQANSLARHFGVECTFRVGNGFDLSAYEGQFDLAFSSGVIEHFPPEKGVEFLRQNARAARFVMAIVPTDFALRNDPITEASGARSMNRGELKGLMTSADLRIVRQFGFGIPDGKFSPVHRHLLPGLAQGALQSRLGYACTIGCIGQRRALNTGKVESSQ